MEMELDVLRKGEPMVCMKYKTVAKKVKPLLTNSKQKRKDVLGDPKIWKSMEIGHTFIDKTRKKLCIGGGGFLIMNDEE